jgi:uncharacterized protein involved in cysteine biosynthesis
MHKDEKQLIGWIAAWMFLLWQTAKIGGGIGLTLFICGTALMLMYAYVDYKLEQARKHERKKVIDGAARIEKAYQAQEEKDDVQM